MPQKGGMNNKKPKGWQRRYRAVLKSIELWSWLVANPGKGKDRWPHWGIPAARHYCFLCEAYYAYEYGCPKCPVKWVVSAPTDRAPCEVPGSPYAAWSPSYSSAGTRRLAAVQVLELLTKTLVEIQKEGELT